MDSESGFALGLGTDLAGFSTKFYYSQAEIGVDNVDSGLGAFDGRTKAQLHYLDQVEALETWRSAAMKLDANPFKAPEDETAANERIRLANVELFNRILENANMGKGTQLTADQITALNTFTVDIAEDSNTDVLEAEFGTNADTAIGNVHQSVQDMPLSTHMSEKDAIPAADKGFGLKADVPAGEGVGFTIGYSQFTADTTASSDKTFRTADGMEIKPYGGGSVKTTMIELGVTYDLGGGATFKAGMEKKSAESIMISTKDVSDEDEDAEYARVGDVKSNDTTTLKATLAFTF
ncbi:MAG: hypothetical protein F4170_02200 [Rhodobacteraceae bacterium]|nr:hypothetical protein [Paracoccaceae bacterium]